MGLWESYLKSLKTTELNYLSKFPRTQTNAGESVACAAANGVAMAKSLFPYDMLKPHYNQPIFDQGNIGSAVGYGCTNTTDALKYAQLSSDTLDASKPVNELTPVRKPLISSIEAVDTANAKQRESEILLRKKRKQERQNKKRGRR